MKRLSTAGAAAEVWLKARRPRSLLIAAVGLSLVVSVSSAAGAAFTEFPIPDRGGVPGITSGPDGALWFIDETPAPDQNGQAQFNAKIGRITTTGQITEFALPHPLSNPTGIAAGPDGALWFTEQGQHPTPDNPYIARITTAGNVTEFPLPMFSNPGQIVAGPDGAMWFIEAGNSQIGRITTAGQLTQFATNGNPQDGIAAGPDGALWFTDGGSNAIGRMTTSGQETDFPLPAAAAGGYPLGIVAGPDGALWFIEQEAGPGYVGRITTGGSLTLFRVLSAGTPGAITAGPDGAVWFTDLGPPYSGGTKSTLKRITIAGVSTSVPFPPGLPYRSGQLVTGPDRALWFTAPSGLSGIGRLVPGEIPPPGKHPPSLGCTVPRVVGKTLAGAKKALSAAHCRLGNVHRSHARKAMSGRVISQSPSAGKHLAAGATVNVIAGR